MAYSPTRIAINGFGRIGRLCLRALLEAERTEDIEVVAINDLSPAETMSHLMAFDSVHGRFAGDVMTDGKTLTITYKTQRLDIHLYNEKDPENLPWDVHDIDVVWECSGAFASRAASEKHLKAGAKRVLISAPANDADITTVFGVNHHLITPEHKIISNASCTTNCLAPMAKVIHETCGIKTGFMTTVHGYTGDQNLIDTHHKDLHRARAAAVSMIPTSTGAAKAVGLVLPHLNGRLSGTAIRVPTPNVSAVDLTFTAENKVSIESLSDAFRAESLSSLMGVLDVTSRPLVSIDFNHDPNSCIVDVNEIHVLDHNLVRVLGWYDNEWGFANRMLDTTLVMIEVNA